MPVVRETYPVVKRDSGSPQEGELVDDIDITEDMLGNGKALGDTVIGNIKQYGKNLGTGILDALKTIKGSRFVEAINKHLEKDQDFLGGEATPYVLDEFEFGLLYPNVSFDSVTIEERTISSTGEEYKKLWELKDQLRNQMNEDMNRAEGSPPQGEMVEEQVDVENVGIMDGFNENPEAMAEQVITEGMDARQQIDGADTYDELMRAIRGDNLSESDRRQELASIVGEKDAETTPDSVLVLVQPVMQMLNQESANTGIAEIESGALQMPQQPVGIATGGVVQKFNKGDLVTSFEEEYLPMYMGLKDYYLPSDDQQVADALMSLSKAGFAYGMGTKPEEAGMLFFDEVGKKGSKAAATEKAVEGQLASGALSSAIAADVAAKKADATKEFSLQSTGNPQNDAMIATLLGYDSVDNFYKDYPDSGLLFKWKGGQFQGADAPPAVKKSYTRLGIITGDPEKDKSIAKQTGLDVSIIPPNTEIGFNELGEMKFTAPKQKKKIEYLITYPVITGKKNAAGEDIIGTESAVVDISTDEGLAQYNVYMGRMGSASKSMKPYWKVEKTSGIDFDFTTNIEIPPVQDQASGGLIRHRFAGSDRAGENVDEVEVAENIIHGIDIDRIPTDLPESTIEEMTPEISPGSSSERVLLQKANIGERAIEGIDKLYEMALKNPQYFGILGYGASIGKSGYLSLDQIIYSLTGKKLPKIDFLESPVIDDIITTVDELAYKIAQVKKEGTFRSITTPEKNAQKDLMNIYAGNARRTMDSLRQMREFLVNDVNEFYRLTGNEEKKFELPDFYNIDPRQIDKKDISFEIIKSKLPPDMIELIDTDPQIKNALEAIKNGADVDLVIERYKEYKKNKAK
jgi:hypothetical protein